MEDLLKFLPIAAYLLYRIFAPSKKKQQKPKQRPVQRKKPNPQSPSLEEILRELSGEPAPQPKQEYKTPVAKPVKKKKKRKKILIEDHQYDKRVEYDHNADTGMNMAEIRAEIQEEKGIATQPKEIEVDIEQAIIYDAILNRPYD